MSRRILLAGFGDLAQRLARRLLARGDTVFGLRRSPCEGLPGLTLLRADLLDPTTLDGLPEALDAVVCTLTPDSRDEAGYRRAYIMAPLNLADALGGRCPRWLFASSTAVYGGDDGRFIDDDTPAVPDGFNGRVLLEAEQALAVRVPSMLALRFSGIYGPGRRMMLRRAVSETAARPHWSNRIHAEDAAAALEFCLDRPGLTGSVIVSDGCPTREDEVLTWLATRLGRQPPSLAPGPDSGRRILPKRLLRAGFLPRFSDFRMGYSSLLQETE
ncbi:NAD-dependent epimerase/dehydratase family protein [Aquimonas voraii]|uniref:Nucleoside-diphosphate-sugar epimerase n=1 Tax=Aquimonas voraii TaxID=265719 RepID=A0A1G6XQS5_9GAMM|nr:NAD-dependent epimerase/dehydratase family protein [Aquimonas voraii]SDD80528.1 Nucleoside-diphosphate-sugar epimerase [Aquimonas voraii]